MVDLNHPLNGTDKLMKNIVISNKYIMSCLALPYGKCVKASTNYYNRAEAYVCLKAQRFKDKIP